MAISSCVNPSASCTKNTVRHPSGSASTACINHARNTGSESRAAVVIVSASSSGASRARSRLLRFNALSDTDTAIVCSQVPNAASPRNLSIPAKARTNVSCVSSRARCSAPVMRYVSR